MGTQISRAFGMEEEPTPMFVVRTNSAPEAKRIAQAGDTLLYRWMGMSRPATLPKT